MATSRSKVLSALTARLDAADTVRRTVVDAVRSEINGHMHSAAEANSLIFGEPLKCRGCGHLFLERREQSRDGLGFCSQDCATRSSVGKSETQPFPRAVLHHEGV